VALITSSIFNMALYDMDVLTAMHRPQNKHQPFHTGSRPLQFCPKTLLPTY
jgi:hypothetical protein